MTVLTDAHRRRHVVLVGMMGSGKTTVGRRVAALLDRPFVDADEELDEPHRPHRRASGSPRRRGRVPRRRVERARRRCSTDPEPAVIAAGGGVVIRPRTGAALREPRVRRAARRRPGVPGQPGGQKPTTARCSTTTRSRHARRGCTPSATAGTGRWPTSSSPVEPAHEDGAPEADAGRAGRRPGRRPRGVRRPSAGDSMEGRRMIELEVPLGDRSYPVLVGPGARHRLLEVLPLGVRAGRGRHPAGHRRRRRPRRRAPRVHDAATARRPRTSAPSRTCAATGPSGASPGATWWWPSAAGSSPTPPGSPPPCTTGASRSCTCRPRCSARSTPPSAARPA